ncbi:MAG TPA: imidazolonepropionase [Polyangiaceae bacterium]
MSAVAIFAGRVVTCDARRAGDPLGVVLDGGVVAEAGRIVAVGTRAEIAAASQGATVLADAPDAVLTPGLCDAHTHAAFAGSRHDEYALRMAGASYEAIAEKGGGIQSTVRAVRAATREDLTRELAQRLTRMASLGVTTVEVKSGYGLDAATEQKQLEAIAAAQSEALPRVVPTYLALHAVPKDTPRDVYVAGAVDNVRRFARKGLARFVDAYVDRGAFSVAEAELIARAAKGEGLGLRVHAGQFADVGAASLAARFGAASADHLENVAPADLEAMARAGTHAVLLPVASFTLAQTAPNVSLLRAAGVRIVVASDANPGTAPTESLPLALALAFRSYGLTPAEALLGATREAASSLGLADRAGVLAAGFDADWVLWDLPHEHAILQPWGTPKAKLVVRGGRPFAVAPR